MESLSSGLANPIHPRCQARQPWRQARRSPGRWPLGRTGGHPGRPPAPRHFRRAAATAAASRTSPRRSGLSGGAHVVEGAAAMGEVVALFGSAASVACSLSAGPVRPRGCWQRAGLHMRASTSVTTAARIVVARLVPGACAAYDVAVRVGAHRRRPPLASSSASSHLLRRVVVVPPRPSAGADPCHGVPGAAKLKRPTERHLGSGLISRSADRGGEKRAMEQMTAFR